MTQARIAREAASVVVREETGDTGAQLVREAAAILHHFPEANTKLRLAGLKVNVIISRPHGWNKYDDPPL